MEQKLLHAHVNINFRTRNTENNNGFTTLHPSPIKESLGGDVLFAPM